MQFFFLHKPVSNVFIMFMIHLAESKTGEEHRVSIAMLYKNPLNNSQQSITCILIIGV